MSSRSKYLFPRLSVPVLALLVPDGELTRISTSWLWSFGFSRARPLKAHLSPPSSVFLESTPQRQVLDLALERLFLRVDGLRQPFTNQLVVAKSAELGGV
mmetsp:Transcript_36517/g.96181  ORF Transcript_36517/g.96181 Transcript_36517/m.96181 type:complete len:100 (+) Transcript_36517:1010-1309(+)